VKAPTLGSNFSGEGDWGPEDVELADLHITVAPDGEAHYNFGVFTISGEDGLTYGDTSLSPDGTYFSLTSSCAGTPIATSKNAVADSGDSARCNQLSFDPGSPASASDPFDAVLVLRFQVTCTGQQSDTCRHVSASAAHPVVLHFSRSIKLHGAVEPPSSVGSGEATNPAMNSAAPQDSSPPGGSQANPAPPAESAPAEASVAAPGSGG
jgi:hypothetical protein